MPNYPTQINSLTSLRYLAAIWVSFFHISHYTRSHLLLENDAFTAGYLGVDFFFVLSGFILTHVYKSKIETGRFDYWDFVSKRFGRIYPMHLFTLALFVGLGAASAYAGLSYEFSDPSSAFTQLDRGELIRTLVANITLIHAWGSTTGLFFNGPSWSISAEWFAYLAFPIFMLYLLTDRQSIVQKLIVSVALLLALFVASAVFIKVELTRMSWNIGLLRIGPEFLLGVILYGLGERWTAGPGGARLGMALSCGAFAASLALRAFHSDLVYPSAALTVLSLAGVVFFAADGERHSMFRVLGRPFFVLLGEISYSVYMLHLLVAICLFELLLPSFRPANDVIAIATVLAAAAATTGCAWLTYHLIEIPGRKAVINGSRLLNRTPAVDPGGGVARRQRDTP